MKKAILKTFFLLALFAFLTIPVSAVVTPYRIFLPLVVKPLPLPTPTNTPTQILPTPFPSTPTSIPPSNTGNIQIISILANGSGTSEPDEYVLIRNMDTKLIQLQNWTLRDAANHVYTFPSRFMTPGEECRIYTNQSHPEYCGFNYGSSSAIWNNSGDTAYLRDSAGNLIHQFSY
ncbi:MAG: hypothetical protein CVU39_06220 [Chloroflexi bacterium HGW-Chloroflexi-10]|nr:MAG: hypothetical protein CVU39_06220 [Chloroflexi bacterium HGW-Chloroflexi-10]